MDPAPPGSDVSASRLRGIGNRLSRQSRHAEAIAAFEAALALDPDCALTHNDLGAAHHRAGQVERAMAAYRRALELDARCAKAHSNLGAAHMDRNEPDLAAAAYRRALEFNPFHSRIRTNLAFAQLLSGDLLAGWRSYE
ncbi:MAG: tetratricopeptide repeat protein, partial [Opitutaceae bacterium]